MKTLQIQVDDGLLQDIARLFPQTEEAANKLAALAIQEWVGWLKGTSRPMTISEQNIHRIIGIYTAILTGMVPDARTLYNDFNIPLGQARYIVQAISYRRAGLLYRMALEEIRDAIDAKMAERDELREEEREAQTDIKIRICESSEKVLQDIILDLAYTDDTVPRPKRADRLGRYVYYNLRVRDVPKIKEMLKERLQGLST